MNTTHPRTDLVTMVLGIWMMLGLFVDGYAHVNIIETIESFFTPWHAIFYSGFAATAAWIGYVVWLRMAEADDIRAAIPAGYGLSILGVAVFALGGAGDAIWHTLLGIEVGVDALLSPTHVLLFLGILMIMTTPLRTAAHRGGGRRLDRAEVKPVILSVAFTTALLGFFLTYLFAPGAGWLADHPFDGATGEGETRLMLGMGMIFVSTFILAGPVVAVAQRWRPPVGLATVAWGMTTLMVAIAFDQDLALAVATGVTGGLVTDLLFGIRTGSSEIVRTVTALGGGTAAAWSAFFVLVANADALQWPPELWAGAILLSALGAAGLAWLACNQRPSVEVAEASGREAALI